VTGAVEDEHAYAGHRYEDLVVPGVRRYRVRSGAGGQALEEVVVVPVGYGQRWACSASLREIYVSVTGIEPYLVGTSDVGDHRLSVSVAYVDHDPAIVTGADQRLTRADGQARGTAGAEGGQ